MHESIPSILSRVRGQLTNLWRLPRGAFWREVVTLSAIGGIVLLVELLGRWHRSEYFDAGCVMVLALTVAMAFSWHKRLRLYWTRQVVIAFKSCVRQQQKWRFEWGLDLRREPPIEQVCPPLLRLLPMSLAAISLVAIVAAALVGISLGTLVSHVSYVVYLVGLAALWLGMLTVMVVGAFLPTWTLMDMVKSHTSWPEETARRRGVLLTIAYFTVIAAAAMLLPAGIAAMLLAGLVLVTLLLPQLPGAWYPDCLWRPRTGKGTSDRQVRAISLGTLLSLQLVCIALLPLMLVLVALGSEALLLSDEAANAPISVALGRTTAWLASGGLLVFLGLLSAHLGVALWYDPSHHVGASLHISGVDDKQQQQQLRRDLARGRWNVRFAPEPPKRADVTIQITDTPPSDDEVLPNATTTFTTSWEQLRAPTMRERIARRDVIQRRRILMNGLQSIFRRAAQRKDRSGSGFWVAPHLWFVDGLTRDEFDDGDTNVLDVIPPLYYKAFPRAARNHFFQISRALKFDLIYVEDGVQFRNLRRVLRVLFERYDIDGGRQPLSDIHFAGLPKVRVMLHDYNFEEPPMKTKYPEPDYQHLGRVRILHVFKDRGDDEEQVTTPEEPDWLFTPDDSPVLVG